MNNIKKPSKMDELMSRRNLILKKKTLNDEEKIEVDKIEHDISDEIADREFDKLKRV